MMPIYNLIEYWDNYSKAYKYGTIKIFKTFSENSWNPLTNGEINLILTWSSACFITNSTDAGRREVTNTKLYVPVVTL